MEWIDRFLEERKKENLLRTLNPASLRVDSLIFFKGKRYIDFSSNDYLGLSNHPRLKAASKKTLEELGVGSGASRLLSGSLNIHHKLEDRVAKFKEKKAALVFNSGYQANIGIISALCKKGDVVFLDKLSHASIIDGVLLSGASFFRFNHNDLNHLQYLLDKQRMKFKNSLIITESLFSMDGDFAPLEDIVSLKKKYKSKIMVDEAHATGVFGKTGSGLIQELGLSKKVDLIMGTFSKALGSFGAYLACSDRLKEYLINVCRSFIYSTSLPPVVIAANLASLDLVRDEPLRRKTLIDNASFFRKELKRSGFRIKGSSQIVPLIVGNSKRAVSLSDKLKKRGHWVLPIRPPTVLLGQARLRFSLTHNHTKDTLAQLIEDIYEVSKTKRS